MPSLAAYERPAGWRELGSGKHKSRGRRRDIKPGLQPSCPRCPSDEDEAWAGRAAANRCSRPVTRRSQGQLGPKKQHKRAREARGSASRRRGILGQSDVSITTVSAQHGVPPLDSIRRHRDERIDPGCRPRGFPQPSSPRASISLGYAIGMASEGCDGGREK